MWPGTAASFAVTSSTRTNLRIFSDHMWEADAQPDNSGHNSRWDTPIVVSFSGTRRERALRVGVAGLATGCHRLRVTVRIILVRYLDQRVPAWTGASVWLRYRHGCWRVRWRTCDAGRDRRSASSGLPSAKPWPTQSRRAAPVCTRPRWSVPETRNQYCSSEIDRGADREIAAAVTGEGLKLSLTGSFRGAAELPGCSHHMVSIG